MGVGGVRRDPGRWFGDAPLLVDTMTAKIKFQEFDPQDEEIGPPCPDHCPDGPESHVWQFSYDAMDGATIWTDECPICNRSVQHSDWPMEYLTLHAIPVKLESFTERYGYYEVEYDHYVVITPVMNGDAP